MTAEEGRCSVFQRAPEGCCKLDWGDQKAQRLERVWRHRFLHGALVFLPPKKHPDHPKPVEHKAMIGSYSFLLLAGWELYNIEVVHLDPFSARSKVESIHEGFLSAGDCRDLVYVRVVGVQGCQVTEKSRSTWSTGLFLAGSQRDLVLIASEWS